MAAFKFLPLRPALLLLLPLLSPTVTATCYFPSGGISYLDVPCDASASESFCCYSAQACLSNQLCYDTATQRYARGTCTDPNWESAACPNFCKDVTNSGNPVFSCNTTTSDSYCCDDGCSCDSGNDVLTFTGTPYTMTEIGLQATFAAPSSTLTTPPASSSVVPTSTFGFTSTPSSLSSTSSPFPSSSTTTSTTSSTTLPPSTSPASASTSTSPSALSTGAKAGIGIGVAIAAVILLLAAVFAFVILRRKRSRPDRGSKVNSRSEGNDQEERYHRDPNAELEGSQQQRRPQEMDSGRAKVAAAELPARNVSMHER